MEAVNLESTMHALRAMEERAIPKAWVEMAVVEPALRAFDPNDPDVEWFFRRVPEDGDRVLRVAVNTRVAPWRVVTVFYDRSMRGGL